MFITASEHKAEWGGYKDKAKIPIAKLPFNSCSLSMLPFENPVCTIEGTVFDIVNIIPFLKKYKKNPVTG
jgi:peptidyl-prolyl cis-trans isomerase-like protein 2